MSKLDKRAISTLVIALFLLSTITAILPLSYAAHTSTATVDFTFGESTVVGEVSSLDVDVTNVAGSDPMSTVIIDFTGTGFTGIGEGTNTAGWTGSVDGLVVTYTGSPISSGDFGTFVPAVKNPMESGLATNPVVRTTDEGVKAILTTGTVGTNEIDYEAVTAGIAGNSISIEYTEAITDSAEIVTVATLAISVELADNSGVISSTNVDVIAAIEGDAGASALVTADNVAVGLIEVMAATALAGGIDPTTDYLTTVTGTLTIVLPTEIPGFSIDSVSKTTVKYGDVVTVWGSGVTAGSEVRLFWDYASGTYAHLLNNTEGNPDGSFDCEVKVPSDTVGSHYLWAIDVATGETISYDIPLTIVPMIKLSPSSGLVGDEITVKGYGFEDESDVEIEFAGEDDPLTTVETDELGYFAYTFDVPTGIDYGDYLITATDIDSPTISDSETFIVGASISLTPDEGPTGTVVTVEGRGWTSGNTIKFWKKGTMMPIEVVNKVVITVVNGKFSADIVIPELGTEGDYDIEAVETLVAGGTDLKEPSSDSFELTGLPEIVVSPTYGSPGATITVTGSNFTQIAGTDVFIELQEKDTTTQVAVLVTAETKSDGTFEDTFMSPAVAFIGYDVNAEDSYYHIAAEDAFKVGLIAMIINPTHGAAGTKVAITGIGFATEPDPGDFNMTFGEKLYEYTGEVKKEAISTHFYVPNVDLGTYDVTVIDEDENQLTAQFTVTAVTEVTLAPAMAPNLYNVSIEGINFADEADAVDFVLYNSTDEWDMDVNTLFAGDVLLATRTTADGNFSGHWHVPADTVLSLGDYTINVTGYDDFFLQLPFSVVEARVDVAPRKALFDRGDTIQFNVKNDFDFKDSYMKIWDPYDNLYWRTEDFKVWLKVGDVYTVPYYLQTSGMNPMTLAQDAPLGTWFYIFYETGTTQLTNGTFVVGPSSAAQVDQKLTEIWASMEGITENIDSITDELAGDIAGLSDDIDDVVADVQDMVDDITADLAGELAGVAEDTEAAVDELEGAIGDIASAQNALQSELEDMSQDTAAAKKAAEDAQQGTQGLTTLVYGAIAASLIAALAAVISLMQISKKIA